MTEPNPELTRFKSIINDVHRIHLVFFWLSDSHWCVTGTRSCTTDRM